MQDCKQLEAEDAIEWASALGLAKRSPHFSGMIRAHAALVSSAEAPVLDLVDEFIDFAHGGAFVFALCAEPEGTGSTAPQADLKQDATCE
jgi:hypothetical protein